MCINTGTSFSLFYYFGFIIIRTVVVAAAAAVFRASTHTATGLPRARAGVSREGGRVCGAARAGEFRSCPVGRGGRDTRSK